jgi:hypothetical protein
MSYAFGNIVKLAPGNAGVSPARRLYADDSGINQIAVVACMVIGGY